jgi:hypothetical protein
MNRITVMIFLLMATSCSVFDSKASSDANVTYGTPDFQLVVDHISYRPDPIYPGSLVVVSGTIKNIGQNYVGQKPYVIGYIDNFTGPRLSYQIPSPGSPPDFFGANEVRSFQIEMTAGPSGTTRIIIDIGAHDPIIESDYLNNHHEINIVIPVYPG